MDNRVLATRDTRGFALGFEPKKELKYVDDRILRGLQPSTVDLLIRSPSLDIALKDHTYSNGLDERLPRSLKQGLAVRVVVRDPWDGFGRKRSAAVKLEFGLSSPAADVGDEIEATR